MIKHRRTRYMSFYIMLTAMGITYMAFYLLDTDVHWIQLAVSVTKALRNIVQHSTNVGTGTVEGTAPAH